MRRNVVFAWSLLLWLLLTLLASAEAAAGGLDELAQAAITAYRRQHGLSAVTADPKLMQLAQEQARAMAKANMLDHSVDQPFAARMVRYNPDIAVENIAAGTRDFASTLEMWKRSAGHNANLLKRGATRFGIATADAPQSKYKVFWALIMAGPHAPRNVRTAAGAPGMLRAAPAREPLVPVRAQTTRSASQRDDSNLFSGLARALRPLWQGGTANTR